MKKWLKRILILLLSLLGKCISWRAFRRTLIAILAAVTLVILLACIDFNSLFVLFHKLAFTNDLWLLNPATDLLIRICPISMFMSMGARIGLIALAWAVFIPALAMVLTAKKERT